MNATFHFYKFILSPARSLPEGNPGSEGTSGSGSENLTMLDCSFVNVDLIPEQKLCLPVCSEGLVCVYKYIYL